MDDLRTSPFPILIQLHVSHSPTSLLRPAGVREVLRPWRPGHTHLKTHRGIVTACSYPERTEESNRRDPKWWVGAGDLFVLTCIYMYMYIHDCIYMYYMYMCTCSTCTCTTRLSITLRRLNKSKATRLWNGCSEKIAASVGI